MPINTSTLTLPTRSNERKSIPDPTFNAAKLSENNQHFNLAYALQSSLELETTLDIFFRQIQDFVTTSSLDYWFDEKNVLISLGTQHQHTVSYTLSSGSINLGNIMFSRAKRFCEAELSALEMLIGMLFFPLRNALLYQDAIQSSMTDTLTKIGNRKAMDASFEREMKLAKRHRQALSVLLIDVDHFKAINDSVGHSNGDKTLVKVVSTIQQTLRETDQVFRFGGEEFLVLLNNTATNEARIIADRIRINVAMSPISLDDQNLFCTISVGYCAFDGFDTIEELIEKADSALYEAKKGGRNRVVGWSTTKQRTA